MPVNRWTDKQNVPINATDYYRALRKNGTLTRVTPRVELENVMLSEINQTWKDRYCVVLCL